MNSALFAIGLAAFAAICVALSGALSSKSLAKLDYAPASANLMTMITGGAIACVILLLSGQIYAFEKLSPTIIIIFVIVGLVQNAVARRLWFVAVRHIGSNQSSTLSATEVIYSMILAIVFLAEKMTLIIGIGAALILCAVFVTEGSRTANLREGSATIGYIAGTTSAFLFGARQVLISFGLSLFPYFIFAIVIAYASGLLAHVAIETPQKIAKEFKQLPTQTLRIFVLIGILSVITQICVFSSLSISQVIYFAPIFSSYPVFTILITRSSLFSRYEVFGSRTILSVVMVVVGAALVSIASVI